MPSGVSKRSRAVAASASIRDEYRDLQRRRSEPWIRRAFILLLFAVAVVALAGVFGQETKHTTVVTPAASLTLSSPTRIRGGLLFQSKIKVVARRSLAKPKIVLDDGFFDGLTLNTTEPQASQELNRNGRIAFEYGAVEAGQQLTLWLQYQVNPVTVGSRTQRVELDDGDTPIATIARSLTSFP
jgi:hypothetical protein